MGHDATRKIDLGKGDVPAFLQRFRITFVILEGGVEGTEYALDKARCIVGRSDDADWTFEDDAVSKHHAALELGAKGVRVVDLDSTNGTYVNGERIDAAYALKHGDQIQIGDVRLQCLIEANAKAPRTFEIS